MHFQKEVGAKNPENLLVNPCVSAQVTQKQEIAFVQAHVAEVFVTLAAVANRNANEEQEWAIKRF